MSTPDAAQSLSYACPAFQVNAHVKTSSTLWANLMLSHTHMQVEGVRQLTLKRVTRICTWVSHTHTATPVLAHIQAGVCYIRAVSQACIPGQRHTHTRSYTPEYGAGKEKSQDLHTQTDVTYPDKHTSHTLAAE